MPRKNSGKVFCNCPCKNALMQPIFPAIAYTFNNNFFQKRQVPVIRNLTTLPVPNYAPPIPTPNIVRRPVVITPAIVAPVAIASSIVAPVELNIAKPQIEPPKEIAKTLTKKSLEKSKFVSPNDDGDDNNNSKGKKSIDCSITEGLLLSTNPANIKSVQFSAYAKNRQQFNVKEKAIVMFPSKEYDRQSGLGFKNFDSSNYNPETSTFIAPIDGIYHFAVTMGACEIPVDVDKKPVLPAEQVVAPQEGDENKNNEENKNNDENKNKEDDFNPDGIIVSILKNDQPSNISIAHGGVYAVSYNTFHLAGDMSLKCGDRICVQIILDNFSNLEVYGSSITPAHFCGHLISI